MHGIVLFRFFSFHVIHTASLIYFSCCLGAVLYLSRLIFACVHSYIFHLHTVFVDILCLYSGLVLIGRAVQKKSLPGTLLSHTNYIL